MTSGEHRATALRLLELSDRLLADDDKILAAEALWGAAIHEVNAVAILRGLPHGKYSHKLAAVRTLSSGPEGTLDLTEGFLTARTRLHVYFDKAHLTDRQLFDSVSTVKRFVRSMVRIAEEPPPAA